MPLDEEWSLCHWLAEQKRKEEEKERLVNKVVNGNDQPRSN